MHSVGDMMKAAEQCRTKEEAAALVDQLVGEVLERNPELIREQARSRVMSNIGYCSGYEDRATAYRILELFNTRHPIFGGVGDWPGTPEETVALGMKMGAQAHMEAR